MSTTTKNFVVTGMSCSHCENAIKSELGEIKGISDVKVSAETGDLSVTIDLAADVTTDDILEAVEEAGYEAKAVA